MGSAPAQHVSYNKVADVSSSQVPTDQHKKILYTNTLSSFPINESNDHDLHEYSIPFQKSIRTLTVDLNVRLDTIKLVRPLRRCKRMIPYRTTCNFNTTLRSTAQSKYTY